MKLAVLIVALSATALGLFDVFQPYRAGLMGFDYRTLNNGDSLITRVYPGSPSEREGIRPGDVMELTRLSASQNFAMTFRRVGQTIVTPISRNGETRYVKLLTTEYSSIKPIEEGPLALAIILIFAATGILVALRGADRKIAHWLSLFLAGYALQMAGFWFSDVATTPALAFAGNLVANAISWVEIYMLLLIVGHFPPFSSPFRTALQRAALPLVVAASLIQAWIYYIDIVPAAQLAVIAASPAPAWLQNLVWGAIGLLIVIAAIEGLMRAGDEHRVQMRWVGGALILSEGSWLVLNVSLLLDPNPRDWFAWVSLFTDVPLLAVAYAILRHRLVDLSIVFSRAAIFGFVSITLVTLFIAGEWVAAQIVERGLGADVANGWVGKAVPLAIALAVGLSARSIHAAVERKLNALFFGKREKSLAALHRLALEADVVTDTRSLLDLAYESVRQNIEGEYAAIYLQADGGYERARGKDAPARLGVNDPAIVRLRRWNEPFEVEFGDHALSEALCLPMTVRGSLLGALVCGPKRERTHYLSEEIAALALVAHRVGTAYELLTREGGFASDGIDIAVLRELIRAELQALHPQPT